MKPPALTLLIVLCGLWGVGGTVRAGDWEAGKAKSIACMACHGTDGVGTTPQRPNLAGQKAHYLVQQLKAFRSGERTDPSMNAVAKLLSDEDIDNLAAYYSRLTTVSAAE